MLTVQQLNLNKSLLVNNNLRQMLIIEKNPWIYFVFNNLNIINMVLFGHSKCYNVFSLPRSRATIVASKDVDLVFLNE